MTIDLWHDHIGTGEFGEASGYDDVLITGSRVCIQALDFDFHAVALGIDPPLDSIGNDLGGLKIKLARRDLFCQIKKEIFGLLQALEIRHVYGDFDVDVLLLDEFIWSRGGGSSDAKVSRSRGAAREIQEYLDRVSVIFTLGCLGDELGQGPKSFV
jgi:hypothetical protein